MGRQIQIFATYQDEVFLVEKLRKKNKIELYWRYFGQDQVGLIEKLEPVKSKVGDDFVLYNAEISKSIFFEYYDGPCRFATNDDKSCVIQFIRSKFDGEYLDRGRLWYEPKFENQTKDARFIRWCEGVFRLVRKIGEKTSLGDYCLPDAANKFRAGELKLGNARYNPPITLVQKK